MNLGQYIGELRMRAEAAEERAAAAPPAPAPAPLRKGVSAIRELLRQHPDGLTAKEVRAAVEGVTSQLSVMRDVESVGGRFKLKVVKHRTEGA